MTKPPEDNKTQEGVTPDSGVAQEGNGPAVAATTTDIRQQLIAIIQEDFGEISRRAFELRSKGRDARGDAMNNLRFYEEGEFVWYDDVASYMPEIRIGKPDDYLEIRKDYGALKEFIGRIVDKGIVHVEEGTHGDPNREANYADYVTWLHRHNNNQAFRKNVERAVLELLGQEFDRDYIPLTEEQAKEEAVRKFSPQFNRLIGLLNIVAHIGEHNARFAEVAALLKQKAEEKFMIDAPSIQHHYSATDIYKSIFLALSSVQQGDELHQFWLDNIENDPSAERVIASVHGLLTTSESQEERRRQLPALLARLTQRQYDMDTGYKRFDAIGFYFDENFLNDVLRHVTRLCYPRNTFHHLDKDAGTLDFLEGKDVKLGSYDFRIERFTPEEQRQLCASFDIAGDSISGNTELEPTVRAYLDRYGYELPNGVKVTSLEGRKIIENKTKVVTEETSMEGIYEGFLGLNHTHFAFVYEEATRIVRIAKPTDSRVVLFGVSEGWTQRRKGLDKVESKIPYAEFQDLTTIGQQVNAIIADIRANRLGDSLSSLEGKLSEEIASYLSAVIQGRLIQNADGLVQ